MKSEARHRHYFRKGLFYRLVKWRGLSSQIPLVWPVTNGVVKSEIIQRKKFRLGPN